MPPYATPRAFESVSAPPVKVPMVAEFEWMSEEDANVAKRFVDVAFPSDTFPLEVRLPAVKVVPSYVNPEPDVTAPSVVTYGMRFAAKPESVSAEVEAVPK